MKLKLSFAAALFGLCFGNSVLRAEEGLWTFDNFPAEKVRQAYGFAPDAAWLDHVRLASVRLPGCSAGIVSRHGLVLTNHHCVARLHPGFVGARAGSQHDAGACGDCSR